MVTRTLTKDLRVLLIRGSFSDFMIGYEAIHFYGRLDPVSNYILEIPFSFRISGGEEGASVSLFGYIS